MPNAESQQLTDQLIILARMLHEQMKRHVTKQPLSTMQLHALAFIERRHPLMRDLALCLTITPPSATSLVNGLVRSKLATRLPDPDDQRALRLTLTPHGKKALQDRLRAVAEGMQEITSVLRADELKTFTNLMKKIVVPRDRLNS